MGPSIGSLVFVVSLQQRDAMLSLSDKEFLNLVFSSSDFSLIHSIIGVQVLYVMSGRSQGWRHLSSLARGNQYLPMSYETAHENHEKPCL